MTIAYAVDLEACSVTLLADGVEVGKLPISAFTEFTGRCPICQSDRYISATLPLKDMYKVGVGDTEGAAFVVGVARITLGPFADKPAPIVFGTCNQCHLYYYATIVDGVFSLEKLTIDSLTYLLGFAGKQ